MALRRGRSTIVTTISEKDGATIIVIENPTGSELRLIEKAKEVQNILSDDVWAKFACNKGKAANDQFASEEGE